MRSCNECAHCVTSPEGLERLLPGLGILSSAYGSSRGDTALCQLHNAFLRPGPACSGFLALSAGAAAKQSFLKVATGIKTLRKQKTLSRHPLAGPTESA